MVTFGRQKRTFKQAKVEAATVCPPTWLESYSTCLNMLPNYYELYFNQTINVDYYILGGRILHGKMYE